MASSGFIQKTAPPEPAPIDRAVSSVQVAKSIPIELSSFSALPSVSPTYEIPRQSEWI